MLAERSGRGERAGASASAHQRERRPSVERRHDPCAAACVGGWSCHRSLSGAYGVSCRARAERVALRRHARRLAPKGRPSAAPCFTGWFPRSPAPPRPRERLSGFWASFAPPATRFACKSGGTCISNDAIGAVSPAPRVRAARAACRSALIDCAAVDLGLAGQDVRRHRREPRASASRPRAGSARRGRRCCSSRAGRTQLRAAAGAAVPRRAGAPSRSPATSPSPMRASGCARRRRSGFGRCRRAGQQRRERALARPRRRPRRRLAGGLGGERDGLPAGDARGRARDARARLGPRRQRLQHRRQAALALHARVLGREGGAAVAVAALRRPLRRRRRARERDLPRPDEVGAVGRRGRPRGPVGAPSRAWPSREEALAKAGAGRPIGRLAEVGEIAAAIVFLCSAQASYVAGAAWSVDGGTVQVII